MPRGGARPGAGRPRLHCTEHDTDRKRVLINVTVDIATAALIKERASSSGKKVATWVKDIVIQHIEGKSMGEPDTVLKKEQERARKWGQICRVLNAMRPFRGNDFETAMADPTKVVYKYETQLAGELRKSPNLYNHYSLLISNTVSNDWRPLPVDIQPLWLYGYHCEGDAISKNALLRREAEAAKDR